MGQKHNILSSAFYIFLENLTRVSNPRQIGTHLKSINCNKISILKIYKMHY